MLLSPFRNTLTAIKAELHGVALRVGEDWDAYQAKVEQFLVDWERHNASLLQDLRVEGAWAQTVPHILIVTASRITPAL